MNHKSPYGILSPMSWSPHHKEEILEKLKSSNRMVLMVLVPTVEDQVSDPVVQRTRNINFEARFFSHGSHYFIIISNDERRKLLAKLKNNN
jgi:hypothetical protein